MYVYHTFVSPLIAYTSTVFTLPSNKVVYFQYQSLSDCITLTMFIFVDDHSRVILKNNQDGNDYINANYIEASIID